MASPPRWSASASTCENQGGRADQPSTDLGPAEQSKLTSCRERHLICGQNKGGGGHQGNQPLGWGSRRWGRKEPSCSAFLSRRRRRGRMEQEGKLGKPGIRSSGHGRRGKFSWMTSVRLSSVR
jgi:hypothetical protein